ncbi:UNVERIFIED_CONTAM: hypothetical protein Sradi_7273100 [Sesamum radiatum]|uniref:Uncharacterized protein n=1 Tax=Sesamum radiatum TaxID=300843 RepID=A0AAW2IK18_SESRA
MTGDGSSSWNSPSSLDTLTALDRAYNNRVKNTATSRTNPRYSHRARDCHDSSSLRTTPVLSEPGTQVIPTNPPRLPYNNPRESVQSS